MIRFFIAPAILFAPFFAMASSYQVGGGCGVYEQHVPNADIQAHTATGVNINTTQVPLENIAIPLEIPLNNYINPAGVNADLSQTNLRPGEINVNTQTGTVSMNGHDITAQPIPRTDCAERKGSIYSTK